MTQDIHNHIALADKALAWAARYGKESFPSESFKNYRRRLRKIAAALSENCSAAAYGESQVGKSYLMSSLLSSPGSPFVITHGGRDYSFIDDLNPSGGNNSKVESTGVITRFTLSKGPQAMSHLVRVRNLSVVDVILLLVNTYYNDVKICQDTTLRYDEINQHLDGMRSLWTSRHVRQNEIGEDDIKDIGEYLHDVIGNAAAGVNQSSFCSIVAPVIQYVPCDRWVDVFALLWNKNPEMSHMFGVLVNEYKKIGFKTEVCIPFEAVLRERGTILKIQWLDTVCGVPASAEHDDFYTDIYDTEGHVIARDFGKGYLSALISEITFELPEAVANERPFLRQMDLLDFPGARSRQEYKEEEIRSVLPLLLRRGKVAYLFDKYSRSLRISSVLFCFHNDQQAAPIGGTVSAWVDENIGSSAAERTAMLEHTGGISPLFLVATKFNMELARTKNDKPGHTAHLSEHWKRFKDVLPEIVKPSRWLHDWVVPGGRFGSASFQNIYPLRDFYWSRKNEVFDGYSDGGVKSEEKAVHHHADYPEYFDDLRCSFLQNEFVRTHFVRPEQTWDEVATLNNDGSKAIIRSLDAIAGVLDVARRKKYLAQLREIKEGMYRAMQVYYEPEEEEGKNIKVKKIAGNIRRSLYMKVGERPEVFGKIIDKLMVPVGDLRRIAYDIIICHTDTPRDFSQISFIRKNAGVDLGDSDERNIERLCQFLFCDKSELEDNLQEYGCSTQEIISSKAETLTTVADVVAKHIIDYWNVFIHRQTKELETLIPHTEDIVFMLSSLLQKHDVRRQLADSVGRYCKVFDQNEQPNAIADYAALVLNNFVCSVGRSHLTDSEIAGIRAKAEKCGVVADLSPEAWKEDRSPKPIEETLLALEEAEHINNVSKESLMKLPLWSNFRRWENLVTIGLLYASDISKADPEQNAQIKALLDECSALYSSES